MFRAITSKGVGTAHLVYSLMQRLDYGRSQRTCHIAYAQAYNVCLGVRFLIGGHLLGYISKKIVLLQF